MLVAFVLFLLASAFGGLVVMGLLFAAFFSLIFFLFLFYYVKGGRVGVFYSHKH